jgi:hypothetical protein
MEAAHGISNTHSDVQLSDHYHALQAFLVKVRTDNETPTLRSPETRALKKCQKDVCWVPQNF